MKKQFSFNRLLHNDRFILVLSILGAIVIWALVSFGPSNVIQREITVPVTVDLTNTIAGYNDLRVIGDNTFAVTVSVEGPRSVVFNLNSDDISIRPNISDVQGPGKADLQLSASKAGKATNYTISGISPAKVTVDCDYWTAADFTIATDVSAISVSDEKTQQLGDVVLDATAVPNGVVRLEGPRTAINRISSVVARVEETTSITNTTRFSAELLALDEQGAQVDLTNCQFLTPSTGTVDLTVPVWVQKKVDLTYKLLNVPAGLNADKLVSLSMSAVALVGEKDELESMATTVADLGTFDFDHLTPEDAEIVVTLNVPSTIKVLEDKTVTVNLAIGGYTTKTLSYSVNDISDVTVENLPDGQQIMLQSQKLTDIVLCGKAATLKRITAKDLEVVLDASSSTGSGSVRYAVRVRVPKYPDVWVYYGENGQAGLELYGTVE